MGSGGKRVPQPIPDSYRDLFEKRALAHLATLMPDGTPQVTPVWVLLEPDGYLLVNSAKGRQKDRNMRSRRRVALSIADPDDPFRYVTIRGAVEAIEQQGADEVIDRLSAKYTGHATYQDRRPGEIRVTYRIRPDHVHARG